MKSILLSLAAIAILASCSEQTSQTMGNLPPLKSKLSAERASIYTPVKLTADISLLSAEDKLVLPLLIDAAKIMDEIFWKEAYGNKEELLGRIEDETARGFAEANYGPWDRLNGDSAFLEGIGPKPEGAGFYPPDMTKSEFEKWNNELGKNEYTIVTRDTTGALMATWYHDYFKEEVGKAAVLLRKAASITTDKQFSYYLQLRAEALEKDRYKPSDIAWLDLKTNALDIVIGPIENYEDKLYGKKCTHEAYVLVRDQVWSRKLEHFAALLPGLQKQLPVDEAYRRDSVGTNSQLSAFDVVYYAGDCNSGGKTIAVNLPNDEEIQQQLGTRKSQLKNAMRAKYDKILVPISEELIDTSQRKHITFDAFFSNVMFHEVAHGLGVKNLVNGGGFVKDALKEEASALEEAKADVLGLWLVGRLREQGEITDGDMMDNYVTFVASVFRSCRFGASSAHGKANMLTFNFLEANGAFKRDPATGTYLVDGEQMKKSIDRLAGVILKLQGDGAYSDVKVLMQREGIIKEALGVDLERVNKKGVPVDVIFEQGASTLGL